MKVDRILETALYASDLEAAEAFYTKVMGLEVQSRVKGRHVFFRCGAGFLLVFNPEETLSKDPTAIPSHGSKGPGHVAWAVPLSGMDAWRAWLEDHGVAIETDSPFESGRSLYFRDPAGNLLELTNAESWG